MFLVFLTVPFYTYFVCVLQMVIGMILNVVSAALAITAVVLYSVDLANDHTHNSCKGYYYSYSSAEENWKKETCLYYRNLSEVIAFLLFR